MIISRRFPSGGERRIKVKIVQRERANIAKKKPTFQRKRKCEVRRIIGISRKSKSGRVTKLSGHKLVG